MFLLSNRLKSLPLQWTILAGTLALSACSSTNQEPNQDRQSNDASMPDLDDQDLSINQTSQRSHHKTGRAYRKSAKPVVHSMPINHNGQWLNAYYFVTSDSENWSSLSEKFYGATDRASLLAKWNAGQALNAGAVVYYNSPFRPTDRDKILSFAEDFGQAPRQHEVRAGDTLSKIAVSLWGNMHAWPAIAAANPQIAHPDLIQVGEVLWLPPSVNSQAILANLLNSPDALAQDTANSQSVVNTDDQIKPATQPATAVTQKPTAPMRSSSIIVLSGIILVLSAAIYGLWKRSQKEEAYVYQDLSGSGNLENLGNSSNLGKLSNPDKTTEHRLDS